MQILNLSNSSYIDAWDSRKPDELLVEDIQPYTLTQQAFVIIQYKNNFNGNPGFVTLDKDFRSVYFGDVHWTIGISELNRPKFHFRENLITDLLGNIVFFQSKVYGQSPTLWDFRVPLPAVASRGPKAFDSFTGEDYPDSIRDEQRARGPLTSLKFIRAVGRSMIKAFLPEKYWF